MPLQRVLTSEDLPQNSTFHQKIKRNTQIVVVSSKRSRVDAALTLLGQGAEGYFANLSDETAVEALFKREGIALLRCWKFLGIRLRESRTF